MDELTIIRMFHIAMIVEMSVGKNASVELSICGSTGRKYK